MKNFNPVRWQNFTINKEIRRIKKESSKSFWDKVQLFISVLTMCGTILLQDICDKKIKYSIMILLGIILILVFFLPIIIRYIKDNRLATKSFKHSDLIRLFDEEIVYNIIIAYEFYKEKILQKNILDTKIINFYGIEQKYYIEKVIKDLIKFKKYKNDLVGKDRQISEERWQNILDILEIFYNDVTIVFEEETKKMLMDLLNK